MKKAILFLSMGFLLISPSMAEITCFLLKEKDHVILREGDCKTRHAPCSTFKIALSLMGYNEELLTDETHPELPFQEGYVYSMENWKQPHTPALWMKNSCVWYSQVLTQQLGMEKFQKYVTAFDYGNRDVSGDKGKNNGLTQAWLSSSLEISPEEQTVFLQKLLDNKLPVSSRACEMTKKILFVEELADGWTLYGKTGAGSLLSSDRMHKLDLKMGWYVGWIQKDNRAITFAHYIQDEEKKDAYPSRRAREAVKERLKKMIQGGKL